MIKILTKGKPFSFFFKVTFFVRIWLSSKYFWEFQIWMLDVAKPFCLLSIWWTIILNCVYRTKKRKFSNTLDYDNSESVEKMSKKAKSDVRLKTQEKRLKEQNLKYESKETYNPKTKRTSRVLVCLHDGCGKEFKKTRNLIIHSRVHTKIRPHVCQYCNKGFTQQCNLKKHIELHLNGTFKSSEVVA